MAGSRWYNFQPSTLVLSATMDCITDGQTDRWTNRQHYDANSQSCSTIN